MNLPKEIAQELDKLAVRADKSHRDFNTWIATLSAGVLAASVTVLSAFAKTDTNIWWLKVSWICLALILGIIALYQVLDVESSKIILSLVREKGEREIGKEYTDKQVIKIKRKLNINLFEVKMMQIVSKNSHWIAFILFLVGIVSIMIFGMRNIGSKGNTMVPQLGQSFTCTTDQLASGTSTSCSWGDK